MPTLAQAVELLNVFATNAVVRGRCVWCANTADAADGQHTETCAVIRARALIAEARRAAKPFMRTCPECGRVFDILEPDQAAEFTYGHDCEVTR